MKKVSFVFYSILLINQSTFAQTNYATKLAETIMNTYKDSMVVKKYASHLEQDKQIAHGQTVEQAQLNRPAVCKKNHRSFYYERWNNSYV
jgi:hypothetical protein